MASPCSRMAPMQPPTCSHCLSCRVKHQTGQASDRTREGGAKSLGPHLTSAILHRHVASCGSCRVSTEARALLSTLGSHSLDLSTPLCTCPESPQKF